MRWGARTTSATILGVGRSHGNAGPVDGTFGVDDIALDTREIRCTAPS